MKCKVLASGSKGNISLIHYNETKILIDMGLSCKRIEGHLRDNNIDPNDINGILITHEHKDHISGLRVFLKKYKVPVYTTKKAYKKIKQGIEFDIQVKYLNKYEVNKVGELDIIPFELSHDAIDPIGFSIQTEEKKYVHITDTGYLNRKHYDLISDADVYYFESNHDIVLLREGSYPWHLQQRILSDVGHLSNIDATDHLNNIIGNKTHTIILAHLSEENNSKDVTLDTINNQLKHKHVNILIADQYEPLDEVQI